MRYLKSNYKRKVYSYLGLPQRAGKIPNKQPKFIPKETRKRINKNLKQREVYYEPPKKDTYSGKASAMNTIGDVKALIR